MLVYGNQDSSPRENKGRLAVIGSLNHNFCVGYHFEVCNQLHFFMNQFAVFRGGTGAFPTLGRILAATAAASLGLPSATRHSSGFEPSERLFLVVAGTDYLGVLALLADGPGGVAY